MYRLRGNLRDGQAALTARTIFFKSTYFLEEYAFIFTQRRPGENMLCRPCCGWKRSSLDSRVESVGRTGRLNLTGGTLTPARRWSSTAHGVRKATVETGVFSRCWFRSENRCCRGEILEYLAINPTRCPQ